MTITLRPRTLVILAALLALAGGIAYALNQAIQDRTTGLLNLDTAEAANLQVVTYGSATGSGPDASAAWCQGNIGAVIVKTCTATVESLSTFSLTSSAAVESTTGDTLAADNISLAIWRNANTSPAIRDACRNDSLAGWTQVLAPSALSALPTSNTFDAPTTAIGTATLCFRLTRPADPVYTPGGATVSTSANIRFTGTQ